MIDNLPDSAKSARETGSKRYFTGKPCKHGHVAARVTATGNCIECMTGHQSAWARRNRPKRCESLKLWRERDRERYLEINRNNAKAFRQRHEAEIKARFSDPNFRALRTSYEGQRRAQQMSATPPWLTQEHRSEMAAMYREARRISRDTGVTHHVDHIEPLRGEVSCGLHVPWNLQVISWEENLKKGNQLLAA